VEPQEEDCRALCARHGWDVAHVYVDNDVSAYSRKARPQWQQMLADIHAGRIGAIVLARGPAHPLPAEAGRRH
jgi:DNA invertase Pin-like site-specific DNA recombinase